MDSDSSNPNHDLSLAYHTFYESLTRPKENFPLARINENSFFKKNCVRIHPLNEWLLNQKKRFYSTISEKKSTLLHFCDKTFQAKTKVFWNLIRINFLRRNRRNLIISLIQTSKARSNLSEFTHLKSSSIYRRTRRRLKSFLKRPIDGDTRIKRGCQKAENAFADIEARRSYIARWGPKIYTLFIIHISYFFSIFVVEKFVKAIKHLCPTRNV